jgi:hypothetical protein
MVIHQRFAYVVLAVATVGAAWAVLTFFRPAMLPALRIYLRLTVAAVTAQVIVGVLLVIGGERPQPLHWFYGAATLVSLPMSLAIGGSGGRDKRIWLIGGAMVTVLFALRAITTAGVL